MTFEELIRELPEHLFDGALLRLLDGEEWANIGDYLAVFVFLELKETFDPEATLDAQWDEAYRVMMVAERELEEVRIEVAQIFVKRLNRAGEGMVKK